MATVVREELDRVVHLRLNRPGSRNALTDEMFDDLVALTEALTDGPTPACVVISGEGKSFCAGLDFGEHQSFAAKGAAGERPFADPDDPTSTGRIPGRGQRIVQALRDCPAPVVVALHGHAIGAGLQIALGADLRFAAPDVKLGVAEIDFGMTVDMGGSQLLPRLVGSDRAMDLILSGRLVTGVEAYQLGLVTRLVDDPIASALEFAAQLAERNPTAITQIKRLVRLTETATIREGFAEELRVMSRNVGSPDQVAAVARYFERRRQR